MDDTRKYGYSGSGNFACPKRPLTIGGFSHSTSYRKIFEGVLSVGWKLRKIHDIEVLIQEVIERNPKFAPFLPLCQKITEYYIETRYPTGFTTDLNADDLQKDLALLQEMKRLITF